jgi:hypothetical protein
MMDELKQTYSEADNLSGKSLYRVIAIVIVIFLMLGILIGYINSIRLNKNETKSNETGEVQSTAPVTYKGTVTYLGEDMYFNDGITYSLTDSKGDDIILLKSSDQKLSIAQGLFVTVTGKKGKTLDGKYDVLQVTEVTLNNGSN